MKKITIQFHATFDEVSCYASDMATRFNLFATLVKRNPFSIHTLQKESDFFETSNESRLAIFLTQKSPNINANSFIEFRNAHSGSVNIEVGLVTPQGLKESFFSFMSEDEGEIKIASTLARELKKRTKSAPISFNIVTGAESIARTHRYTQGAKNLYDNGVSILHLASKIQFRLK